MPTSHSDLLARLTADCPDDHALYAIVSLDHAESEADVAQALGLAEQTLVNGINLYSAFSAEFRRTGPRLVPLLAANLFAIGAAMQEGRDLAVICVALNQVDSLATHLQRLGRQTQPDGGRLLFRFQDPLVLSNLLPLLRGDQLVSLLGPASRWAVTDPCGTLHIAARTPHELRTRSDSELRLDARQLESLSAALHPGTVILQANEVDSTLLADKTKCAQWTLIRQRSDRARGHGLRTDEDIALFVVLSLQLPDSFDRSGPIAEALARSQAKHASFGDEVDEIDSEEWEQWQQALELEGHQM
ncbi:DUF4123 domain-containing protein [Cognatilysobacter bugurensis]|uniref:DUF4123 domain-containing protein n=1 Tax=Cognatilysobacter bugurensis TaxID=543356 RepID=UPI00167BACDC|nr:DUF4123 domain-containing protein [Lysobacter bugurensis]